MWYEFSFHVVIQFMVNLVNMIAMWGWSKFLTVVHCCAMVRSPFKGFFRMSFYHPSLCTLLHFPVLFNDFQPFINQRKAHSQRLWLNQYPLSLARSSLSLFYYLGQFTLPSFYLSLILPLSCISFFHSGPVWPINHLCWRAQPPVLCNFFPPTKPCPCL